VGLSLLLRNSTTIRATLLRIRSDPRDEAFATKYELLFNPCTLSDEAQIGIVPENSMVRPKLNQSATSHTKPLADRGAVIIKTVRHVHCEVN
jgi:hypothetical protein